MSEQKTLYILLMLCLSGIFPVSGCQTGAKSPATSDDAKLLQDSPVDYVDRGRTYYDKEQFDDAIAAFNKAVKINPEDVDAYYYRGCTYFAKENLKKALKDYNTAIKLNPEYVNAYINRGYYYHLKSEYPRAIADYKKALELNPNSAAAKQLMENAISDRQLYEERIRDNSRLKDMGITIRNDHAF